MVRLRRRFCCSLVKHVHYQSVSVEVKGDGEHTRVNEEKFKKSIIMYKVYSLAFL